jgi:hypothetical protein
MIHLSSIIYFAVTVLFIPASGHCLHDHVANLVTTRTSPQLYNDFSFEVRERDSTNTFPPGFSPVRITFDTRYLSVSPEGDPGYTCIQKGTNISVYSGDASTFYACTEKDVLTFRKSRFIKDVILERAKEVLNHTFAVRPIQVYFSLKKLMNREIYSYETKIN